MSGDRREQQEFDGRTLIFIQAQEDEELQLWTSSGHMMLPDERLRCLCVSDQTGSAALNLWRDTGLGTSFRPAPQNCPEVFRTRLVLNTRDVFTFIARNGHLETRQSAMTTDRPKKCIVFCSEDVPSRLFADCRTIVEETGPHVSDNNNSTAFSARDPNNNSVVGHCDATRGENFNLRAHKSPPAETCGKDGNVRLRKSVSFDNDVMVYLFDQDSPTMKLHSGPDVTLEDNGLEWEDDFCCVGGGVGSDFPLPPPGRYLLSQTCMFLTHVAESDLEL